MTERDSLTCCLLIIMSSWLQIKKVSHFHSVLLQNVMIEEHIDSFCSFLHTLVIRCSTVPSDYHLVVSNRFWASKMMPLQQGICLSFSHTSQILSITLDDFISL